MERSFGERAQEMDPEEIRLARQRVADLIRAGDDVEQEIVRMGREGFLTDTLILVIQNRLNFARHDNERHVVQCLDLLLRRIEAEREAQEATPALRLLNTLLHLADDLSADISNIRLRPMAARGARCDESGVSAGGSFHRGHARGQWHGCSNLE
ncbi:hypothetical protein CLOP_g8346 [Closterium sp. NIES-67]|nr:hypothetical protein CLOP_g8346 [Closterium sp. NIES-67]